MLPAGLTSSTVIKHEADEQMDINLEFKEEPTEKKEEEEKEEANVLQLKSKLSNDEDIKPELMELESKVQEEILRDKSEQNPIINPNEVTTNTTNANTMSFGPLERPPVGLSLADFTSTSASTSSSRPPLAKDNGTSFQANENNIERPTKKGSKRRKRVNPSPAEDIHYENVTLSDGLTLKFQETFEITRRPKSILGRRCNPETGENEVLVQFVPSWVSNEFAQKMCPEKIKEYKARRAADLAEARAKKAKLQIVKPTPSAESQQRRQEINAAKISFTCKHCHKLYKREKCYKKHEGVCGRKQNLQ